MARVDNTPSASLFAKVFKATDYKDIEFACEYLDNACDALERNNPPQKIIKVYTDKEQRKIIFSDNGIGMDKKTIREALRLASKVEHDNLLNGSFGIGAKEAGFCKANKITYISKKENEKICSNKLDLKDMIATDIWDTDVGLANKEEVEKFKKLAINQNYGTVCIIEDIDNMVDWEKFEDDFIYEIGVLYYSYIVEKKFKFYFNDRLIKPIDIFFNGISEKVAHFSQDIEGTNYEITIYKVPEVNEFRVKWNAGDDEWKREVEKRYRGKAELKGYYVVRNNRLLKKAAVIGKFPWSGDGHYACARVMIRYSASDYADNNHIGLIKNRNTFHPKQIFVDFCNKRIYESCIKGKLDKTQSGAKLTTKKVDKMHLVIQTAVNYGARNISDIKGSIIQTEHPHTNFSKTDWPSIIKQIKPLNIQELQSNATSSNNLDSNNQGNATQANDVNTSCSAHKSTKEINKETQIAANSFFNQRYNTPVHFELRAMDGFENLYTFTSNYNQEGVTLLSINSSHPFFQRLVIFDANGNPEFKTLSCYELLCASLFHAHQELLTMDKAKVIPSYHERLGSFTAEIARILS